jgi:diguanylate cyclase (GGDEF)-like protein/PAS domain S-box-containing protein
MATPDIASPELRSVARLTLLALVAWSLAIGGSLYWNLRNERSRHVELATAEALFNLRRDYAIRHWLSEHGGVYMEPSESLPASPHLAHLPESEVTTPSGRRLALIAPAYLLRKIQESSYNDSSVRGRVVGLMPLNPVNAPDAWEADALRSFEDGGKETTALVSMDGRPFLRAAQPIRAEVKCLNCHGGQFYETGDLLGAISYTISLDRYIAAERQLLNVLATSHAVVWLGGVLIIGFLSNRARDHLTERIAVEHQLRHSEERARAIFENAPDAGYILTLDGRLIDVNDEACRELGYTREELLATQVDDVDPGLGMREAKRSLLTRRAPPGGPLCLETVHRRKDGSEFPVELHLRAAQLSDQPGVIAFGHNVTERLEAENRHRLAAKVFDETSEGIMITDAAARIISVNRSFTAITGYSADEALGHKPSLLRSGRHDGAFYRQLWDALLEVGSWRGEIWNRRKDGEIYPQWLAISTVRDAAGKPEYFIGIFSDITRQKRDAEHIRFLAYYDGLTGLPNRSLLADRVAQAIAAARRSGRGLAVLFMDLDGFKHVNDSLGHLVGDELLRRVGERLKQQIRDTDTLARFGGDEFVLMLSDVESVDDVRTGARRCIEALGSPIRINEHEINITPSIGVSVFPADGEDFDQLIKNADTAMYRAKESGRNQYRLFEAGMNAQAVSRATLGNHLRRALERGQLLLHYQPQADIASGEIVGIEALVRWQHPELGLVPPADFIPVAEEIGVICALGEWVLNEACRQAVAWQHAGLPHLPVAVNLSALQLRRPDFLDTVRRALDSTGLEPHWLEVELTESVLMHEAEAALSMLRELSKIGIRVAVDDFGTGYSSLAYLRRLPIDKLKIDRSFVRDLTVDRDDWVIVSTIIRMAHSLNLKVIAEGVETGEHLAILRAQGCDEVQGYHLSRPLPAEEVAEFIRQRAAA